MDYMGTSVFSNFGSMHVASQRYVFTKNNIFVFFWPYNHFSSFFRIKKDAQRNLATNGPYESPWTPIFDHLVQFWIMSVPKQPPLKLKPVYIYIYIDELRTAADPLKLFWLCWFFATRGSTPLADPGQHPRTRCIHIFLCLLIALIINIFPPCLQNATEIENAFIYVTERSMQTLQLQLQLQLQLFNNTSNCFDKI